MRYSAGDRTPMAVSSRLPNAGLAGAAASPRSDGLAWQDVLVAARRRLWLVLGVPAVLLVGTAIMVLRETPIYRATAVLRLGDARRAMTSVFEASVEPTRLMDPLFSQTYILKSRALLGSVVVLFDIRPTT